MWQLCGAQCTGSDSLVQNLKSFVGRDLKIYRKVASRSTSRLVARPEIFRLFIKGKFDPYVLWPLAFGLWPLNSRPVYCSRLYGRLQAALHTMLRNGTFFEIPANFCMNQNVHKSDYKRMKIYESYGLPKKKSVIHYYLKAV